MSILFNTVLFSSTFVSSKYPGMLSSSHRSAMSLPSSQNEKAKSSPDLGFGDLCRYFYRALREDFEEYIAHNVMEIDCQDFYCIGYFVACHDHG